MAYSKYIAALVLVGISMPAQSALIDRGNGLIYDSVSVFKQMVQLSV